MFRPQFVRRIHVCILLLIVLLVNSVPLNAQENEWLPAPTGPYQVGTTTYHWVDETRDEVLTDSNAQQ